MHFENKSSWFSFISFQSLILAKILPHGGRNLSFNAQILPSNIKMTTMARTSPRPPVGGYPQSLLWDQTGMTPKRMRINTTIKTVPMQDSFRDFDKKNRRG